MKNNIINKIKRIIPSSFIAFTLAFSLLITSVQVSRADEANTRRIETQCGYLDYVKSAEALGNDKYKISFNIKSTLKEAVMKKADIVLLIDTSGSMGKGYDDGWGNWHDYGNKIENIKTSAKSLCETLMSTNSDINIGIVTFDSDAKDYLELTSLNKDSKLSIESSIDKIEADGATNTEDGIDYAGKMLNEGRTDSDKYLIMFTDGYPTMSKKSTVGGWGSYYYEGKILDETGSTACDVFFKDAQSRYNSYFGGISSIGGLGFNIRADNWGGGWRVENTIGQATSITPEENAPLAKAKVYSIGCLTQVSDTDNLKKLESGPKFLYSIQNDEKNYDAYKSKYFTENQADINKIFDNIAKDIRTELIAASADNVIIKDVMSNEFVVPEDVQVESSKENVKVSRLSESEINLELGNIGAETIDISFVVDAKDPYFSGDNILTNTKAELVYNDPKDKNKEEKSVLFNEPSVTIEPKMGELAINKIVNNPNNLEPQDDSFNISIKRKNGEESYNIKLVNNETENMSFLLKDINTDITNNHDYSKSYLSKGTYIVNEVVPMNYKLDTIRIKVNDEYIDGNEFTIDKDNSNVSIEIINNTDNDKYWWGKDNVDNVFPYVYENPSTLH